MKKLFIPLGIIVVLLIIFGSSIVSSRNSLVEKDEAVNNSFADLDAVLQRRADLIPNLSAAVRAALEQEQEVFGDIADARTRYAGAPSPEAKVAASDQLSSALARLLVIMENYPQLESNQRIQDLMTQIEGTENRVNQARRDYNGVATAYNVDIRRFPRNIVAGIFGFERKPLFEADPTDREAPQVDLETDDDDEPAPAATG
ncbi:MAG: LemA family protein [Actinomycetota bacterium]